MSNLSVYRYPGRPILKRRGTREICLKMVDLKYAVSSDIESDHFGRPFYSAVVIDVPGGANETDRKISQVRTLQL